MANERYFTNHALKDDTYDGKAFGSNAVALPGSAYVDLSIEHQLGSEQVATTNSSIDDYQGTTSNVTNVTKTTISFDMDNIGDNAGYPRVRYYVPIVDNQVTLVIFEGTITSGSFTFTGVSVESGGTPPPNRVGDTSTYTGAFKYEVIFDNSAGLYNGNTRYFVQIDSRQSYGHIDFTNMSVKEITTNNSYLTYTDPETQDIVDVTLPTATKYKMENDFSNAVSHDISFSQADLDLMKADPLTLMRVFFDGLVLPSGFAKVNIKNLYCGNEGLRGGSIVYDLVNP